MHHFEAHELADSWELRAGLLDADPADASISACLRECAAALRAAAVPDVQPKGTRVTGRELNRFSVQGANIYDHLDQADVLIRVDGDWESEADRDQYVNALAARLQAPAPAHGPMTDDEVGALTYEGNTVSFIKQRAKVYGDEITACWQALREAGFVSLDGRLSRAIRTALATQAPAVAHKVQDGMVLVPVKPTRGLLISMAIRSDHGLGIPGYYDEMREHLPADHPMKSVTHAQRMQSTMNSMRQLHEEVVGTGFYKPEREASYVASFDVPVQGSEQ